LAFSNQFHFADKSSQRELAEPSNWQTINHPSGKSAQYPAYATIPGDAASEKPTESLFAPVGGTQFAALKMLKIQSDKYATDWGIKPYACDRTDIECPDRGGVANRVSGFRDLLFYCHHPSRNCN